MRKVGKIDGLYSDLLLHDMGPELSDPAAAIADGSSFSTGGYYAGGGSADHPRIRTLWPRCAANGARRRYGACAIAPRTSTTAAHKRSKRRSAPMAAKPKA